MSKSFTTVLLTTSWSVTDWTFLGQENWKNQRGHLPAAGYLNKVLFIAEK